MTAAATVDAARQHTTSKLLTFLQNKRETKKQKSLRQLRTSVDHNDKRMARQFALIVSRLIISSNNKFALLLPHTQL